MTPKRLFIEDIPYGKLIDYLLATSNLPVFKRQKIDNKRFLDGGTYDNCSVEMLYEAGYRDIIAIRIFKRRNRIRNYNKLSKIKDLNLKIILPSEELSSILNFNSENLKNMLEYGYIDTIKQLKGLDGNKYAIEKIGIDKIEKIKNIFTPSFSYELVKKIGVKYKIGENIIDVAINRGMKKINNSISNNKTKSFKKQLINMIEYVLLKENTFKNKIYTLDEVILIAKKILEKNANNEIEQAIYYIIENIT
jgi:NTE family protein